MKDKLNLEAVKITLDSASRGSFEKYNDIERDYFFEDMKEAISVMNEKLEKKEVDDIIDDVRLLAQNYILYDYAEH